MKRDLLLTGPADKKVNNKKKDLHLENDMRTSVHHHKLRTGTGVGVVTGHPRLG